MAKVSVYNIEGKEVDTIELNDAVFGVEVNEHLVHLSLIHISCGAQRNQILYGAFGLEKDADRWRHNL